MNDFMAWRAAARPSDSVPSEAALPCLYACWWASCALFSSMGCWAADDCEPNCVLAKERALEKLAG